MTASEITFHLPERLCAAAPAERRGLRRDHVRLMVSDRKTGASVHTLFYRLAEHLRPKDVLVLNDSRTVPAVFRVVWQRQGRVFEQGKEIRLARRIDAARWEALAVGGGVRQGDRLLFSPHLAADVEGVRKSMPELVLLRFSLAGGALFDQLYRMGEPVRYEYVNNPWSLSYYQTVFANHPGSVEMPSAGRAFSWELLFTLKKRGVRTAFLTLHTGLSDFDAAERMIRPEENCEFYAIPEKTARLIREAKQEGGRIIAVGTTAVRALESAAEKDGTIRSGEGWTCLRIGPGTQLQICDGLITGFHEPEASHLDLLSAFAAPPVLMEMYREALEREYLWHEFGDLHLIL